MTVYIKIYKNNELNVKQVMIADIAKVWCEDDYLTKEVNKLFFTKLDNMTRKRVAFSSLDVIKTIKNSFKDVEVVNVGENDFVIDYDEDNKGKSKKIIDAIKVLVVSILTLAGSSYAIIAYNNDVGAPDIFEKIYRMFLGERPEGNYIIEIMFSVGLLIGIVVFYNHFRRKNQEPTPLQIEMNEYENQVDDTFIESEERKR